MEFHMSDYYNGHPENVEGFGFEGKYILLSEYLNQYSDEVNTFHITQFAIIDMDGNGIPEVIIEYFQFGNRIVFYYEKGEVYGIEFSYRGLNELKKDGTYLSSGGAFYTEINKLQFFDGVCKNKVIAYSDFNVIDGELFYINDEQVSDDMFLYLLDNHFEKENVEWYPYIYESFETEFTTVWENIGN